MSVTLLEQVFNVLKDEGVVKTQTEFAQALGVTKSYISALLRQATLLPEGVREALAAKYNINSYWLMSNGEQGTMRGVETRVKSYSESNTIVELLALLKASKENEAKLLITIDSLTKTVEQLSKFLNK